MSPDLTPAEWAVVLAELRDREGHYTTEEKIGRSHGNRYRENRARLAQSRVRPIVDKIARALLGSAEGRG